MMIDAFERLTSEDMEETEIYIQKCICNVIFRHDTRVNLNMLRTALSQHAAGLNKALPGYAS